MNAYLLRNTRSIAAISGAVVCACVPAVTGCASDEATATAGDTTTTPTPIVVSATTSADQACTVCGGACAETVLDYASRRHVPTAVPITYDDEPPAGGDHDPCWASWQVQGTPIAARNWVHNLEHGGVVLLYHCADGCAAEVSTLTTFVEAHAGTTLLAPDDTLPKKFAVIAWGRRLLLDCFDEAAITAFYDAYQGKAPEATSAAPPATCL